MSWPIITEDSYHIGTFGNLTAYVSISNPIYKAYSDGTSQLRFNLNMYVDGYEYQGATDSYAQLIISPINQIYKVYYRQSINESIALSLSTTETLTFTASTYLIYSIDNIEYNKSNSDIITAKTQYTIQNANKPSNTELNNIFSTNGQNENKWGQKNFIIYKQNTLDGFDFEGVRKRLYTLCKSYPTDSDNIKYTNLHNKIYDIPTQLLPQLFEKIPNENYTTSLNVLKEILNNTNIYPDFNNSNTEALINKIKNNPTYEKNSIIPELQDYYLLLNLLKDFIPDSYIVANGLTKKQFFEQSYGFFYDNSTYGATDNSDNGLFYFDRNGNRYTSQQIVTLGEFNDGIDLTNYDYFTYSYTLTVPYPSTSPSGVEGGPYAFLQPYISFDGIDIPLDTNTGPSTDNQSSITEINGNVNVPNNNIINKIELKAFYNAKNRRTQYAVGEGYGADLVNYQQGQAYISNFTITFY